MKKGIELIPRLCSVFGSSFIQSSSPHSHLLLPLLLACLPAAHLSSPVQEGQITLHLPWHCMAPPLYPLCLVAERIVWVMTAVRSGGGGEDMGTEILKGDDGEWKGWRKCSTWCSLSSTTSSSCFGTWTLLFPFPVIAVKWSSCCALWWEMGSEENLGESGNDQIFPKPSSTPKKKKKSNRNHIGSLSSVASERIVFYFSTVSRYLSQRSCFSGRKDYGWLHPINLKSFLRKRDGVERAKWLSTAWEQQAQLQWIAVPMLVGFPARSRHAAVAQLPAHQRQSL